MLQYLSRQRLPEIIEIEQSVVLGKRLNAFEIEYLSRMIPDERERLPTMDRHHECEALLSK